MSLWIWTFLSNFRNARKRCRMFWRAKNIKNIKANVMVENRAWESKSLRNRGKERFWGRWLRRSNNPQRIRNRYQSFATGGCSKAFVKSYLKVKGHCICEMPSRIRWLSGRRETETFGIEGQWVRNARRVFVKAELPDDQRALKEDWDASAATRLTTHPCIYAYVFCVCVCVHACVRIVDIW